MNFDSLAPENAVFFPGVGGRGRGQGGTDELGIAYDLPAE